MQSVHNPAPDTIIRKILQSLGIVSKISVTEKQQQLFKISCIKEILKVETYSHEVCHVAHSIIVEHEDPVLLLIWSMN